MVLASLAQAAAINQIRLTSGEITTMKPSTPVLAFRLAGIHTTVFRGDPMKPGLHTIRLPIAASTTIQAHAHRDNRSAVVM
jgi:hypothetical protein